MSPDWTDVERLYHAALARAPGDRPAFLREACGDDVALRSELESLLAHAGAASRFLNAPAIDSAAQGATIPQGTFTGRQIGIYRMVSLLGAGGMGEVYRARDTKLGRDVAIKVLPPLLTTDRDRLGRFQREARVLATLNHPNIGAIYGLEEADGVPALVLELIEGETLADRLSNGPLPVPEALRTARDIAEALDAAHQKGIVHRDLKPSNIKVVEGRVKVLDFGLAKAGTTEGSDVLQSTAVAVSATRDGVILGTAAYMSPEQARGKPVDKRSDIWAFGCVLYEMLTGHSAFGRETVTDTLAGVVDRDPEWAALPASTPPAVVRLLRRCLEKDRTRRLHDIADVRIELDDLLAAPGDAAGSKVRTGILRGRRIGRGVASASVIGVAALGVLAAIYFGRTGRDAGGPARLSISAPGVLTPQTSVVVSPDGRRVAFVSTDPSGRSMLWVRDLDSLEPRVLAGTEDAAHPFWSPDGAALGFLAGGKLKRVGLSAGGVMALADVTLRSGASWSRRGAILFAPRLGQLATVSATGGPVTSVLTSPDPLVWPSFLPDGKHFLFALGGEHAGERRGIYIGSLDSHETTRILASDFKAAYADPGYLLFVRGETLMAQPFDATHLRLSGEPAVVAEGIWTAAPASQAAFSVSQNGVLAYVNSTLFDTQLRWFDRTGRSLGTLGSANRYSSHPQIAPDGSRVAIARGALASAQVWILNVADAAASRLPSDSAPGFLPIWSSDGKRILFASNSGGAAKSTLVVKEFAGGEAEDVVGEIPGGLSGHLWDWSSDGRFIVYGMVGSQRVADLWALPLTGDRKPFPFAESRFHKTQAQLSPDGRWIAYTSYDSGRDEVYVQSFPAAGSRRQVSPDGGMQPRWRRDGAELFYVRSDQYMMAAPVKTGATFESGTPAPLFRTRIVPQGSQSIWFDTAYDVTPDGQRFLFSGHPDDPAPPMTVVLNWPALTNR